MMLFEKVILWLAPCCQSAWVAPVKRGPEAERFSSVPQVSEQ